MTRCYNCNLDKLNEKTLPETMEVAGITFTAQLPAIVCGACGEASYEGKDIQRFELAVARKLAELGEPSGDAFRFMRKAIGMKAVELAHLLNLEPETISRWENQKRPPDEWHFLMLSNLVEDHCTGSQRTLQQLKGLREPRAPKPSHVSVVLISSPA